VIWQPNSSNLFTLQDLLANALLEKYYRLLFEDIYILSSRSNGANPTGSGYLLDFFRFFDI